MGYPDSLGEMIVEEQAAPNNQILPGDSLDYDVLYRAACTAGKIQGLFCEIGVRRGGSLQWIIDAASTYSPGRTVVGIDPYGNIEYNASEGVRTRLDYTNSMKNEGISEVYRYAMNKPVNVIFFNLEDTEFFKRFGDGVPVYNGFKTVENRYALVFFDGPHDVKSLHTELDFFIPRTMAGSVFVFDDVATYPHFELHTRLLSVGFKVIEVGQMGRKISYIRG
jgi:cephalosporin hydroxylase